MNNGGGIRRVCYAAKAGYMLVVFLVLLSPDLATSALGQQGSRSPETSDPVREPWRWNRFTAIEDWGVRSICEDRLGNIWFGTDRGPASYNGRSWTFFDDQVNPQILPVQHIEAATDGIVYAASESGFYSYFSTGWHTVFEFDSSATYRAFDMAELQDGSILLATDLGVIQVNDQVVSRIFTSHQLSGRLNSLFPGSALVLLPNEAVGDSDFSVTDILEDSRDYIWFAISHENSGKLLQFRQREISPGQLGSYKLHDSRSGADLGEEQKLLQSLAGDIWVVNRSFKKGIHIYDYSSWQTVSLSEQFSTDEYCTDIALTTDGTIWVASLGRLYTFKNGAWRIYRSSDTSIPANKIQLTPGGHERLWIYGLKSKVFRLEYSDDQWITRNNLNFQCESANGTRWFLRADGRVVASRDGHTTLHGTPEGLIDAPVRLIETAKGAIWAAGSHRGVAATAEFKDGRWRRQLHPKLSWGIDYRAVMEAFNGDLWFGAAVDFDPDKGQRGGVLQLTSNTDGTPEWILHAYRENGLLQSNAYGIGQSKDGRIWIGGGSLYFFDGKNWNRPENALLQDYVNIVQSTPDGTLLVGSRFHGIFIFDGEKWSHHNTSNGLESNTVMSLYGLSDEDIWAATESDICRFDGRTWVNSVLPDAMRIGYESGFLQTSADGTLWINQSSRAWNRRAFGQNSGSNIDLSAFRTYGYKPDLQGPETHIDVFAEQVSPQGDVVITWSGEDYMSFTPANKLAYSYRLDGQAWSEFSHDNHKTFLNLDHGDHTLEVRARDLDLNVDPTPASITFHVQPPVWKQGWFIALIIAFVVVLGLFEYRVIRKNSMLENLNESLSAANAELKHQSQQVAIQKDEILRQQGKILEQKDQLEKSYDELSERNSAIEDQRDQLAEMLDKIEELNRSKIQFFTNVSHELRTPLTLILGPVHKLKENIEQNPVKRRKLYGLIERNAFKLLKLINQLLEMRRIENDRLELNLVRADLHAHIAGLVSLFEDLAAERNIEFRMTGKFDKREAVFDKDKVEKIVTNLVSNAFKHTPEGGSITVRCAQVADVDYLTDPSNEQKEYFEISVEDTGTGISEQMIPHIFERYYSDDSDRLSSGIGLTYIKDLVEAHGGHIAFTSKKGTGTTFHILLPADLEENTSADAGEIRDSYRMVESEVEHLFSMIKPDPVTEARAASNPQMKTVLIVENDLDVLEFLDVLLSDYYNVKKATNGLAGLDIARNENVDLVISDIMMPQMDGIELCKHLKSDVVTSHLPVILLTAKAMDTTRAEGYSRGADAYLTKPFNPNVLLSRIENLLTQRIQLRESFARDFAVTPKHVKLVSADEQLLKDIVEIMEEHIDEAEFNVNKMCHMVGMSHAHFIRKVKSLTGKKPVDLLKTFRLTRARDLLRQNSANIAEIAYMVGYNLPNSFSRAFKKEFGMSPKEYAEQHAQESNEKGMHATDA